MTTLRQLICRGGLAVSAYKNCCGGQFGQLSVVNHLKSHLRQSLDLLVVMDNVAKTIQLMTFLQLLFSGGDGLYHPEAETGVLIYYDRHWFSWLAISITCSYSCGVRSL